MNDVDLTQLAVQRETRTPRLRSSNHQNLLSRYVLPAFLIAGFMSLVAWASRDMVFPPTEVRVVPVFATQAEVRVEGSALFNAAGWIEPRPTSIRVASLASGVVQELLVVEDQKLDAGQPVANLVREDAQLAFDRCVADRELAEAELDRAQATLKAAKTRMEQPVHLQAKLSQSEADLARVKTMLKNLPFETSRAESRLRFAKRDFQRNTSAGSRAVSQREIDESRTDFETAEAMVQELMDRSASLEQESKAIDARRAALKLQLELLADEIEAWDSAKAQVEIGKAGVKQMRVAEATAKLQLDRMVVTAPVHGRVYQLVAMPGSRVGTGVMTAMDGHDGATIVTMYQPESLQIRVDVRFEDIPKVALGQPVSIANAALSQPVTGSVLFISSEADIQKNTLQVKVAIEEGSEFFKPEMLVDVTFLAPKQASQQSLASQKEMKLYLPAKHVGTHEGQPSVLIADQSAGRARRINVALGSASNGELIEIKQGLDVGSRVITSGAEGLSDGDRIRIAGEDSSL